MKTATTLGGVSTVLMVSTVAMIHAAVIPPTHMKESRVHSRASAAASSVLNVIQWNPHWQCFGNKVCGPGAEAALTGLLTPDVDFANVIELETSYTPPSGWAALGAYESCGHPYGDWDTLFYNTAKWKLVSNETACMYESRSFTIGVFTSTASPSVTIVPVGAHFPQTLNASTGAYTDSVATLAAAIKQHTAGMSSPKVVLMADTNTEGPVAAAASPSHHGVNKTNGQLMHDLGLWADPSTNPPGAPLYNGCCGGESPPFAWQGDRIVATFGGSNPPAKILFDPLPSWADFNESEFHKGVTLQLELN
eukprot:m.162437 g.162437  ORF g.162437 m.162437 type:complete len:307 (-) comp12192_c0_seq1:160-1080(-)